MYSRDSRQIIPKSRKIQNFRLKNMHVPYYLLIQKRSSYKGTPLGELLPSIMCNRATPNKQHQPPAENLTPLGGRLPPKRSISTHWQLGCLFYVWQALVFLIGRDSDLHKPEFFNSRGLLASRGVVIYTNLALGILKVWRLAVWSEAEPRVPYRACFNVVSTVTKCRG